MMNKGPKGMSLMIGVGTKPKTDDSSVEEASQDAAPDAEMESDEKDDEDSDDYDIPIPEGFEPPDDVQEGDEFDATIRCHVDGEKLCIDSINGIKTDQGAKEEGDEEDEETAPTEEEGQTPKTLDEAMKAHSKSHGMMG